MDESEIVTDKDIIRIFDLRLRWRGALGEDIINENESGNLKSYWIKRQYNNKTNHLVPYRLKYQKENNECADMHINSEQPKCVFFLEEVERIEKEKPYYLEKRTDIDEDGRCIESQIVEDLKQQFRDKVIEFKKRERNYKERISELERKEPEKLGKSKNSYIAIMALLLLDLKIIPKDSNTVGRIQKLFARHGIKPLDDETIRDKVKEAEEYLKKHMI